MKSHHPSFLVISVHLEEQDRKSLVFFLHERMHAIQYYTNLSETY